MKMAAVPKKDEEKCIWLRIIQVNDVYQLDMFPQLKTLIDEHRAEGPDMILVVLSGDFLAPSLLSSLDKGRSMVDLLNLCGFTHVSFGNHEKDVGEDALVERIQQSRFCWVNTNMRELDERLGVNTVPEAIVEVNYGHHSKCVGLLGLLSDDPTLYSNSTFAGAKIEPVLDSTERHLQQKHASHDNVDLWIPLTHQSLQEDRALASRFSGSVFPIIIGGHDHDAYDETHNGSRIIKAGTNAENAVVIDITWSIDVNGLIKNEATVKAKLIPTCRYAANPQIDASVVHHRKILEELEKAKLFRLSDWVNNPGSIFSTANNRTQRTEGSEALVSMVRMGMRAQCGILNGGAIRGNRDYSDQEWFTWSDLKAEFLFSENVVAVNIPGTVLEETIAYSRRGARQSPVVESGGFLQTCSNIWFDDETSKIESIGGKPFDKEALYLTALPSCFFKGIDNYVPLLEWSKGKPELEFSDECGRPYKEIIVELFAASFWLRMGSFDDIDRDGDGLLSRDDVKHHAHEVFDDEVADLVVDNIMSIADLDSDGFISPLEMSVVQYVATDMHGLVRAKEELSVMTAVVSKVLGRRPSHVDTRRVLHELTSILGAGNEIKRDKAMQVLGEVRRKSLLR
jgi:2',3'-cyclic-nucleotide 2'-phosphodiesterase (5'-nucleotidase family)